MAQYNYTEFRQKNNSANISSVYFLYGEEKYLLKLTLEKLLKKVKPENFEQLNFNEFTDYSTVDQIADASLALPFMSEYKCVVVSDFNIESKNQAEINKLHELLAESNESTVLIFTYPTIVFDVKKSAKWKNLLKIFDKNYVAVNFEKLGTTDLSKFVIKTCENSGSSISKQNALKLIEYTGNDMTNLKNEAQKISAFVGDREISLEDIDELAVKNLETTVFILIKSIVFNDYQKAYSLLKLLFESGEEAVPILARISDTYIDLYRVRSAVQSGEKATAPAEYGEYRGREFRLTNAQRDMRNLSNEKLAKSLDLLLETDVLLKSSKVNGKLLLEELIAKLLIINKGENI